MFYNLGEVKFAKGETDEAVKYYQRASDIDPNWGKPLFKLGLAKLQKGDTAGTLEIMNKLIQVDPNSQEAAQAKALIEQLKKQVAIGRDRERRSQDSKPQDLRTSGPQDPTQDSKAGVANALRPFVFRLGNQLVDARVARLEALGLLPELDRFLVTPARAASTPFTT